MTNTAFRILPATEARWTDLAALFGERGACGGCWCMVWRLPRSTWEANKGAANRAALRRLTKAPIPPGVLGYAGREPVGWCAVAPRSHYPSLARSRVLQPVDDQPVWSVSCLFVRKDHRRRGVAVAMLRGAVDFVRRNRGRIVEGYPVVPGSVRSPDIFLWTGTLSAFQRAGFVEVARFSAARPIVRCLVGSPRKRSGVGRATQRSRLNS